MGAYLAIKGKNLLNVNNVSKLYNTNVGAYNLETLSGTNCLYIPIIGGQTYTVSFARGSRFVICTSIEKPALGVTISDRKDAGAITPSLQRVSLTTTANANAKYLIVRYWYASTDAYTEEEIINTMLIENGGIATPYEPYYTYKLVKALAKVNKETALPRRDYTYTGSDGTCSIVDKVVSFGGAVKYPAGSRAYSVFAYGNFANYWNYYPISTKDIDIGAGTYTLSFDADIVTGNGVYLVCGGVGTYVKAGTHDYDVALVPPSNYKGRVSHTFTLAKNTKMAVLVYSITNSTGLSTASNFLLIKHEIKKCSLRMRPTTFPEQYQRVEYIESNVNTANKEYQYIDTGVIGKSGLTAQAKMRWNALQKDGAFLGSRTNIGGEKRIYMFYMYNPNFETEQVGRWYIGYNVLKDTGIAIEKDRVYELKTILKNAKQEFYIDGERVWYEYVGGEVNTGLNLYLFNYNQDNSIISYCASNARLYYLKIYDGDKLVRNFIPCYRKSDGEIGLLDIVSGVFYTNQGTGTFKKGADV